MKKEIYDFIVWKNAENILDKVEKDLSDNFIVRNKFLIKWTNENWAKNLSRFYGTSLPENSHKEIHCGKEYFYLFVIEDQNPNYELRETSHGIVNLNSNVFDKKTLYREWSGGGHKIHCSNDIIETNHDLSLIFGYNINDFCKKYKKSNKIINYNKDLFGTYGYRNIKEMFYLLNNCNCNYVVLRDYQNNFKETESVENYDIDLIGENVEDIYWILNSNIKTNNEYIVKINNHNCIIDIKKINDGYFCQDLFKDIIKTKRENNFYYIPSLKLEYYSCLYHALVHKNNYETEYNNRLNELFPKKHKLSDDKLMKIKELEEWLNKNNYKIVLNHNLCKNNLINIKLFNKEVVDNNVIELLELNLKYQELEMENQRLKDEIKNCENKYNNEKNQNDDLNKEISKIYNSKSWKLTSFFRKIRSKIKI